MQCDLGDPVSTYVSLCHEYHGISLLRAFIDEPADGQYRVMTHKYELPVAKTGDRFFTYQEGEIIIKNKTTAVVEFLDGKVGIYDFEGEQNMPQMECLFDDLQHAQKGEFDGLSEDERAIESMLPRVYAVSKEESDEDILWYEDNLKNALTDAYFTILLQQADGQWVESEKMPWNQNKIY